MKKLIQKCLFFLIIISFLTAQCENVGNLVFKMNQWVGTGMTVLGTISLHGTSVVVDDDSLSTFDLIQYLKLNKDKIQFLDGDDGQIVFNKFIYADTTTYSLGMTVSVTDTVNGQGVYLTLTNGKEIIKPEANVNTIFSLGQNRVSVSFPLNDLDCALLAESGIERWKLYTAIGSTSNSELIKEVFGCVLSTK